MLKITSLSFLVLGVAAMVFLEGQPSDGPYKEGEDGDTRIGLVTKGKLCLQCHVTVPIGILSTAFGEETWSHT